MSKVIDLTGQVFHRLTVIERDFSRPIRAHWICQCVCGNTTSTQGKDLRDGKTKSCGCLAKEQFIKRSTTHNMRFSSEYSVYCAMLARCNNPKNKRYADYGARGITVCQEWRDDFLAFYNHIGPRPSLQHSIDRIDNNLGYKPGNVKWSTNIDQANNKRNIPKYTHLNKTLSLAQWSRETGLSVSALTARLNRGWPIEKVLTIPLNQRLKSSDTLDETC